MNTAPKTQPSAPYSDVDSLGRAPASSQITEAVQLLRILPNGTSTPILTGQPLDKYGIQMVINQPTKRHTRHVETNFVMLRKCGYSNSYEGSYVICRVRVCCTPIIAQMEGRTKDQ